MPVFSPCKCLLPWGAVVSQVRESIQPNPLSYSPGVSFHSYPVALAVEQLFAHSFLPCVKKALFAQGQGWWVGRQAAFFPVHVQGARLPSGSCLHRALDLTTPSSAFTQDTEMYVYWQIKSVSGKQGPMFCTSPIPSLAGAAGALRGWPAMSSTESWSWLLLPSSQHTHIPHALTNTDKPNFDSSF